MVTREHPDEARFYWPQWRFGAVVQPEHAPDDARGLSVPQAKKVGELFRPSPLSPEADSVASGSVGRRYVGERPTQLRLFTEELGGQFLGYYRPHVSDREAGFLRPTGPEEINVAYRWVPIVAFPRYCIQLGAARWLIRDGLTVCAAGSLSKLWLHGLLVRVDGDSTLERGLNPKELSGVRERFGSFVAKALYHMTAFYERVLTTDLRQLPEIGAIPDMSQLGVKAEAEIVGLTTRTAIQEELTGLSRTGLSAFRSSEPASVGARTLRHFIDWVGGRSRGDFKISGSVIALPDCDGNFRGTSSLSLSSRIDSVRGEGKHADLYSVLSEESQAIQAPVGGYVGTETATYMVNQVATHHVAEEFGRYF